MEIRKEREESGVVLDFLPNGYPNDPRPSHRKTPIVQAIGKRNFTLLELVPKKGIFLQPSQEVYIGEGKREEIHHINGAIPYEKLTHSAKQELDFVVSDLVEKNQEPFVQFFNNAGPISTRRHMLELIPGVGKKHMWEILDERKTEPFKSFEDIANRVKLISDPKKGIIKRIIMELKGEDKRKIFVR